MQETKTSKFFFKITKIIYLTGAPNYWPGDLNLPSWFNKIHNGLSFVLNFAIIIFICSEWLALYTQKKLNGKQRQDLIMFSISQPLLHSYSLVLPLYTEKIRDILKSLAINLKKTFNDPEVERQMIRRSKIFTGTYSYLMSFTMISYLFDALLNIVMNGGTFTTVITAWPDVDERGFLADLVRIITYVIWWFFVVKLDACFWLVIPTIILLGYQFRNLKCYFSSLSEIFEKDGSHEEKERQFEEAFKLGVQWHIETLRCTKNIKVVFYYVFSVQILLNISVTALLMLQMLSSERTLSNAFVSLITTTSILLLTGCLMWNAGDVTIEASKLSTAMFESGWHNCRRETSRRIRSLVVIAMRNSQNPVEFRCFGILKLSYESFLSIVKASYSVVSVLY